MEGNNEDFYEDDSFDEGADFEDDYPEGEVLDLELYTCFNREEKVYFLFDNGSFKVLTCSTSEKAKILTDSIVNR